MKKFFILLILSVFYSIVSYSQDIIVNPSSDGQVEYVSGIFRYEGFVENNTREGIWKTFNNENDSLMYVANFTQGKMTWYRYFDEKNRMVTVYYENNKSNKIIYDLINTNMMYDVRMAKN